MASRMPCLSRWRTRSATSPNQGGVARTDSEEVWIITVVSAILFIYASFVRNKCFLLPQGCIFFSWLATCYNLVAQFVRSEEHTSELQSLTNLVCRLLLEKKKN